MPFDPTQPFQVEGGAQAAPPPPPPQPPAEPLDQIINGAATQYRLPPELIRATMQVESGGDPNIVSYKDAGGLMQLMPGTARELGVTNRFDPRQNVYGGAKYLRQMLDQFDGNMSVALAAYNAGPHNPGRWGPDQETYAGNVLSIYDRLRARAAAYQPSVSRETPTTPARPVSTTPYVVGDSLAEGIKNQGRYDGTTRVGANPRAVLGQIAELEKTPELIRGRPVILSSGASNDPHQIDLVQEQIRRLKALGASDVSLVGTGTRPDLARLNPMLQQYAQAGGARFAGPVAGAVHPDQGYAALTAATAPRRAAAAFDPTQPFEVGPSVSRETPSDVGGKGAPAAFDPSQPFQVQGAQAVPPLAGPGVPHTLTSTEAQAQLPMAKVDERTGQPGPPAPEDVGIIQSGIAGLGQNIIGARQTAEALTGARPTGPAAPNIVGAQPVRWSDIWHPYQAAQKFSYMMGESAAPALGFLIGTAMGGTMGSEAGPWGAAVAGTAGGIGGAAAFELAKSLGPMVLEKLKEHPGDFDAAFNAALVDSGIESVFTGIGFGAFKLSPFGALATPAKTALKDLVFQALVAQPGVAMAGKGTLNVAHGQPVTEGMTDVIPGAVLGTAAPALAHMGAARILGTIAAGRPVEPPPEAPPRGAPTPPGTPQTPEAAALAEEAAGEQAPTQPAAPSPRPPTPPKPAAPQEVLRDIAEGKTPTAWRQPPSPPWLPPVPDGYVRLYHGGGEPGVQQDFSEGSRWVTPSYFYARDRYPDQAVHYVDVPRSHPEVMGATDFEGFAGTDMPPPIGHFNASNDIARGLQIIPPPPQWRGRDPIGPLGEVSPQSVPPRVWEGAPPEGTYGQPSLDLTPEGGKLSPFDRVPRQPMRLVSYLAGDTVHQQGTPHEWVEKGGIVDDGGELRAIFGGTKGRPGFIRRPGNGRTMEQAATAAWQAGYFPEHESPPDIETFKQALRQDHQYSPVYSHLDQDRVDAYHQAIERNDEISRLAAQYELPTTGISQGRFYDMLRERMSFEERAREMEDRGQAWSDADAALGKQLEEDHQYPSPPRSLAELEREYREAGPPSELEPRAAGPAGFGREPAGEELGQAGQGPRGGAAGPPGRGASGAGPAELGPPTTRLEAARRVPGDTTGNLFWRAPEQPLQTPGELAAASGLGYGHERAISQILERGSANGNEHGVLVDNATGRFVEERTDDSPDYVGWDTNFLLNQPEDSLTLHHNHPGNTDYVKTLSPSDLMVAAFPSISHIVAVHNKSGEFYAASAGPKVKEILQQASTPRLGLMRAQTAIQAAWNHIYKTALPIFRKWRAADLMGVYEMSDQFHDTVNRLLHAAGYIDYISSEKMHPLAERFLRTVMEAQGLETHLHDRYTGTIQPHEGPSRLPQPNVQGAPGGAEAVSGIRGPPAGQRGPPVPGVPPGAVQGTLLSARTEALRAQRGLNLGPPPWDVVRDKTGLARLAAEIKRIFSPTSLKGAASTEQVIRLPSSQAQRAYDQVVHALGAVRFWVDKLTPDQQIEATDRAERGLPQATPELQAAMDVLRGELDRWTRIIQGMGKGLLANAIENYMGHIWQNYTPEAARAAAAKSPIEGSKSFLKQRYYPTQREGIDAGLIPTTTNPIDMQLIKLREMQKFYYGNKMLDEMKARRIARWVTAANEHLTRNQGLEQLNDRAFRPVLRGAANPAGWGNLSPGNWYAPEPAARIFNNYVSRGLAGENALYDTFRRAGNFLNMAQLGLSAFHATFVTIDSMISTMALGMQQVAEGQLGRGVGNMLLGMTPAAVIKAATQGGKVRGAWLDPQAADARWQRVANLLNTGGGQITMPDFWRSNASGAFFKTWADMQHPSSVYYAGRQMLSDAQGPLAKAVGVPWRLAGRMMDQINEPLMGALVPRVKAGVFAALAENWQRMHPNATPEERSAAMIRFQDSVDNRLGQMRYDNLYWNKVQKDLAFIAQRSVGWNLGTIRELAGGVVDGARFINDLAHLRAPQFTTRMAYSLALPVVVGLWGAAMTYAATGQPPQSPLDYFFPPMGTDQNGEPQRRSIPGYHKDVIEYYHAPVQTLLNKTHPLIEVMQELYHNEDYYGRMIANPAKGNEYGQYADYLLNMAMPFSIRSMLKLGRTEGTSMWDQVAAFWGFQPAPKSIVRRDLTELWQQRQQRKDARKRPIESGLVHIFSQ